MQQFLNFFKTLDTYKAKYRLRRAQIRGKILRVFENDAAPLAIEYDRLPQVPVENSRFPRRQCVLHSERKLPR